MKLVYIEWLDSSGMHEGIWHMLDDIKKCKPIKMRSVGWVLRETKSHVVLVSHLAPSQGRGDMAIPKATITKRKSLK